MRHSQNLDDLIAKVLDRSLPKSHRLYGLQQTFVEFAKPYQKYGVDLLTSFLHNDDATLSFHWDDESYVFVCMLNDENDQKIEISKLLDADDLSYKVLETLPFSFETLESKLNQYIALV